MKTEPVRLRGNEVMPLDDPEAVWEVESGAVGVFVVARAGDAISGRRRHCFRVGPGGSLFGVPPAAGGAPALVAVALEDVRLRRRPSAEVEPLTEAPVREWIARWSPVVGPSDLPATDDSRQLLASFHGGLPSRLERWVAREERDERERFGRMRRRSTEMVREAVRGLAGVLAPAAAELPEGSPLFVAASAVGRARGIDVRRPAPGQEADVDQDPIEVVARASHFRVRDVILHHEWWKHDGGALLGFLRGDRAPVALLPTATGGYEALDPTTRRRRPLDAEVAREIDPQAYTFYRPLPAGADRGLELIRFALHGRARDLSFLLAMAVAATLAGMVTPVATALLIDHAIPDADYSVLGQVGLALLAAAFGVTMFRLAQGIALVRLETAADVDTQAAVWDRLLKLRLSFFRGFSSGDLESRVTAISQIRTYLGGSTLRTLFGGVVLLLNLFLLFYYSAGLALIAVTVAVVSATVTVASGVSILRLARRIMERKGKLFGLMVQLINGVAKLRVAAAEDRAFAAWAREYRGLIDLEFRQRKIADAVAVVNIVLSTLSVVALFAFASLAFESGGASALTVGTFLAFYAAYGTFLGAVTSVSNTVTDILTIAILRERARPILVAQPEVSERKASPGRLAGRIEMDRIAFRYDPAGPVVLDEVSIGCEPGHFVALVGPSGSGKSTVLRLMLGFETPEQGTILFDGQDLSGLDVYAVRRQMGVVLQQGRISAGSIYENAISGTRASLDDAWEAARAAGFDEEIEAMPMGMHTVVSEGGTNLSGGQRQRLLLTRALVHRPRILLLDEATSALDNRTQAIVSESLERLGITRVVVAHRLSTIRNADKIFVIEAGRVVQEGSFGALSAVPGLFARLMKRQQL